MMEKFFGEISLEVISATEDYDLGRPPQKTKQKKNMLVRTKIKYLFKVCIVCLSFQSFPEYQCYITTAFRLQGVQ